jgi:ATP-dependent DNA helicase RecQ
MLGLVKVDHERFNTLKLTAASREVLRGERRLSLRRQSAQAVMRRNERRDRTRAAAAVDAAEADTANAANPAVFEALREWRRATAKEHGVPAYTVFHDSTLRELAARLPQSLEALRGISGIGATKLERYGSALLDVMRTVIVPIA